LRLAIASGKGGTGKTTIATNLAVLAARAGMKTRYLDCDVEEPNGHIFLRPVFTGTREITLPIPRVNEELCDGCGECSRICRFGAIVRLAGKAVVFPELCHSCGGCRLVCPAGAISEVPREIGRIEQGRSDGIAFTHGILRNGCADAGPEDLLIIDSPPGAACPAVNSMRGADLVLLVAEPTTFGLHDLRIAVEMTARLRLPFAVVINRHGIGDERVERYCAEESIEVLARIPDDRRAAESYSRGRLIGVDIPQFGKLFRSLLNKVLER
jgi:MinD superfamily P-loop ATPase